MLRRQLTRLRRAKHTASTAVSIRMRRIESAAEEGGRAPVSLALAICTSRQVQGGWCLPPRTSTACLSKGGHEASRASLKQGTGFWAPELTRQAISTVQRRKVRTSKRVDLGS